MTRTLTSANSAATKKALAASSKMTARIERYMGLYRRGRRAGRGGSHILRQHRAHCGLRHVATGERGADPVRQDEPQPRVLDLLVATHGCQQLIDIETPVAHLGRARGQSELIQMSACPLEVVGRAVAQLYR